MALPAQPSHRIHSHEAEGLHQHSATDGKLVTFRAVRVDEAAKPLDPWRFVQ